MLAILDNFIHYSRNVCGFLTLNEILIKLAYFIVCSINDDLTNTSSTPPSEVKKKNGTVYSTFNNFVYLNRNFDLLEIQGYNL